MLQQSHVSRLTQKQSQVATAHLAQTMTLMGLTAAELRQKIDTMLAENPALELVDDRRCPTCNRVFLGKGPCPVCSLPQSLLPEEPVVFVSPREDLNVPRSIPREETSGDDYTTEKEDLSHFVLRQIAPDLTNAERPIAAHILTNLDQDGLLRVPIAEIARYHHTTLSNIEKTLQLIQRAEPIGVGSQTPQEALLVQLEVLSENQLNGSPIPALAKRAIQEEIGLLSQRNFTDLSRRLGISISTAQKVAIFITENLNPFPGRSHWGNIREGKGQTPALYYNPDVLITCLNDSEDSPLVIEIVLPIAGTLRVNSLFRQALKKAPPDKLKQWKTDLEKASLMVKCIQQRNHTMVRLMKIIAILQRDFILKGDIQLRPLTRVSLASELDLHESTISRAVSDKIVQLPNGRIVPISKFFDSSLAVRTVIKAIILQESKPLSDSKIVYLLAKKGYNIARRTVAKYRSMEGILPANLRVALNNGET